MRRLVLFSMSVGILLCAWASVGFAGQGDEILGCWITEGGDSCVEIFAKEELYFAKIVALKEPNFTKDEVEGMDGKPRVDIHNPDESLRSRALIGIELMTDFQFKGDDKWEKGKIYDPENGKSYKCKMTLKEGGVLDVRGFIGISLLGRTTKWMRPEAYKKEAWQLGFECPCFQTSQANAEEKTASN